MFFAFPEDAHWNDRAAGRRDRGIPRRCPGAAPPVPTPPAGAADPRALSRGVPPSADAVREHRRAEAATAPVDRGWERRDQWAGFALGRLPTRIFSNRAWLEG